MKKFKKVFYISIASALLASFSTCAFANTVESSVFTEEATACEKDSVFEIVADDDMDDRLPCYSSETFSVSSFGGNTSMSKYFTLAGKAKYWKVWVKNTGSYDIKVSIEGPANSKVHTVEAGESKYIYSTNEWPAGEYTVNFTGGHGMYGQAAGRIASTIDELDID